MSPLTMELSGLRKLIEGGRYDIPSDRVASALLRNMNVLRVLRAAGSERSEPGVTPEAETHTDGGTPPPSSD